MKDRHHIHGCQLIHGEALATLRTLPDASVDAIVADPPYSSGGFTRGDRMQKPREKYQQYGVARRYAGEAGGFSGDNRDARSWYIWSTLWLSECQRIARPAAYVFMFCDWRQLPSAADAVQCGGFIWRGVIVWDKTAAARAPHCGYFRHQCEYIVWGTNGECRNPGPGSGGPFPGCITLPVRQADKHHLTGKPTALIAELLRPVAAGGIIVDPFAGSGTTAVAAIRSGRQCIAIETDAEHCATARARLEKEARPGNLFNPN